MIGTCRVSIDPNDSHPGVRYITRAWCAITRLASPDVLIQCNGESCAMVYNKLNLTVIECSHHLEIGYFGGKGVSQASLSIDLDNQNPYCFWIINTMEIPYEVKEIFNTALKAVNAERMMFEDISGSEESTI